MIKAEELNKAGIDYSAGLKRFMDDRELYETVLAAFLRTDASRRAGAAYDAHDYETLLSVVHEVKGSGGNAGFNLLYTEASSLVKLLRGHDYTEEELTERYLRFKAVYSATLDAVKAALGQNES